MSSSYSVEMRANKTPPSLRPLDLATWPFCFSEEARRLDRDSGEHKHLPPVLPDYSILSHLHSGLFWNQFFPGKVYWFMKDCVYALGSIYFQFAYAEQGKRRLKLGLSMHKNASHLQKIVRVILGETNKERLFTQQASIQVQNRFLVWNKGHRGKFLKEWNLI